jgi:ankyrin repeat protein
MHCAARDGHEKVVEYLILKGASLTSRTKVSKPFKPTNISKT